MAKTANAIIRQELWISRSVSAPNGIWKKFRKALIDSNCTPRQAFIAFMHAVGTGEITVIPSDLCRNYRGQGLVFDMTGEFNDYRPEMKLQDGRIINALPYNNKLLDE